MDKLYSTHYWGYRDLSENEFDKLPDEEKVLVFDKNGKKDMLEYFFSKKTSKK